jgi:F420-dependent oxidoreductase-like protein
MKIGLQIPKFTWPGGAAELAPRLVEIAKTAEGAGFYSLWVMDHFFQLDPHLGKAEEPMLEGYTALSYLAGVTERLKLGTLVTGVIYREPGFLVKQATTLDVLSGGRAYYGVGAAWYEREAYGLGFPFPPVKERFERLEETLQITQQMWSGEVKPYNGVHYQLAETLCQPLPLQKPHPPIMIGGMGEKKTLKLVAQYADACNLFVRAGMDVLAHKLEVLKGHCKDVGRPYEEIELTTLGSANLVPGEQTPQDVVDFCRELADLGIQHAIFNMPGNVQDITPIKIFGDEIIPAVAGY